jgi:succinyl-diaminopimelate desuccinylase
MFPVRFCLVVCLSLIAVVPVSGQQQFVRGDVDQDETIDLADAIKIFRHTFFDNVELVAQCADAADTDDNGRLGIFDGLRVLHFYFFSRGNRGNRGNLSLPFPECGLDPTPDDPLGCESHAYCPAEVADDDDFEALRAALAENLDVLLPELVGIPTVRRGEFNDPDSLARLGEVKTLLDAEIAAFNSSTAGEPITSFEWIETVGDTEYWLFGYRVGSGSRKISFINHADVVEADEADGWTPWELTREDRVYRGTSQPFLVGRGALDDKGPMVVSLTIMKELAEQFPSLSNASEYTFEWIIDTSEETDMATPNYLNDPNVLVPELGIVFDAMWCVTAEKGLERPTFSVDRGEDPATGVWVQSINTPQGNPTNAIPSTATVVFASDSKETMSSFADALLADYEAQVFDDPDYRKAEATVSYEGGTTATLAAVVAGAQHGSAPQENRADGANPLVSVVNFVSNLASDGTVAPNSVSVLSQFVASIWGTRVFGEHHPDTLERFDSVFQEGNGTTYAVTRFETGAEAVQLYVDIRYAIGHQQGGWDNVTYGLIPGDSVFGGVFSDLVKDFNAGADEQVQFTTSTFFGPDIRSVEAPAYSKVDRAFQDVMGTPCPQIAIGGGTDAKGNLQLIAAGTLFTPNLGPPVNFHGISEGAPVGDLENSAMILYQLLLNELAD